VTDFHFDKNYMTLTIAIEPAPLETDTHGVIRVGKTRVTLDTVVTSFLEGALAEEIADQYPSLQLSDIYLVLGYYLRHKTEINSYLTERRLQSELLRQETEKRFNPIGIKDRLLARRNQSR
jgi:uncharacterized protein (DUF433 family)